MCIGRLARHKSDAPAETNTTQPLGDQHLHFLATV